MSKLSFPYSEITDHLTGAGENIYGVLIDGHRDRYIFDGWYTSKKLADQQYRYSMKTYPGAHIHLVMRTQSEWRTPTSKNAAVAPTA
jgi:hypothetical protein